MAVATYPTRLYQANVAVRRVSGIVCDNAACSTARNGPTSFPVGERTPIVAARMSSGTQSVSTKATPATTIRMAPATRTRRRPIRSAWVVSQSEISVSPTSVSVSTSPMVRASRPRATR